MSAAADASSYRQYCPISRALDLIGDRWTLLIVRDLICGATHFNELARGLPGLSRSLLAKRLRQLQRAGVVAHEDGTYVLTSAGRDLQPVVFAIGGWGASWAFDDPRADERDPELLIWWMHRRLDTSAFPGDRHVVLVDFTDDARSYWIVIERGEPSVCRSDPQYPVDLTLRSTVADLYRVWLGSLDLTSALREGVLDVTGQRAWTRRVGTILQLSLAAPLSLHAARGSA